MLISQQPIVVFLQYYSGKRNVGVNAIRTYAIMSNITVLQHTTTPYAHSYPLCHSQSVEILWVKVSSSLLMKKEKAREVLSQNLAQDRQCNPFQCEIHLISFTVQNIHQGYPHETLMRFLKAREGNITKAHNMVRQKLFLNKSHFSI